MLSRLVYSKAVPALLTHFLHGFAPQQDPHELPVPSQLHMCSLPCFSASAGVGSLQ